MSGNRRPTKDELDLWRRFTADVERLKKKPPLARAKPPPKDGETAIPPTAPRHRLARRETSTPKQASPPPLDPGRPINTDGRTFERLRRGKVAIEKRLDLHGRTQTEAHQALDRFLAMSAASGLRCVLIVTGKGSEGQGVLRQAVPRWLAEPGIRDKVITYCPAHPRHGGDGALYVLIKRRR